MLLYSRRIVLVLLQSLHHHGMIVLVRDCSGVPGFPYTHGQSIKEMEEWQHTLMLPSQFPKTRLASTRTNNH